MNTLSNLIEKYDVPGPRYTSYPPLPFWEKMPSNEEWFASLQDNHAAIEADLYLHIAYCKSLCLYCGCNRVITKDTRLVTSYIDHLILEWQGYLQKLSQINVNAIHFGGGTPTYMSVADTERLLFAITKNCTSSFIGSIEADPRTTTVAQLNLFFKYGFKRISFGIQDFDESVQRNVNRIQPFELVAFFTEKVREIGFSEVNFDLIYGLPGQSAESVSQTIEKVGRLSPDTIAFYSYAHVPNFAPHQKELEKFKILEGHDKRHLYELGRKMLLDLGYVELGMDHFTKQSTMLYQKYSAGELTRSFMGYTVRASPNLIGLGASSISSSKNCYIQNEKDLNQYQQMISSGLFSFVKGHMMTVEDHKSSKIIHDLMCKGEADIGEGRGDLVRDFIFDGLVEYNASGFLKILEQGRPFLRNICMVFDHRLKGQNQGKIKFSRTI